jgi:hypothetical protein
LSVGNEEASTMIAPLGQSLANTASMLISPVGTVVETPPLEFENMITWDIIFPLIN